jgi:ABC-type dipeptide/oligopeptide/nickel transport system permease component
VQLGSLTEAAIMTNTAALCLRWLRDLALLAVVTGTLLFFLLRLAGDPAVVLAGPDASEEQLQAVRAEYGLDRSPVVQYGSYLRSLLVLDFGNSLADGTPALAKALTAFPASLLLAGLAIALTCLCAIPLGVWLGARSGGAARTAVRWLLFALQGFPGFVVALVLVQVFAIELTWLPALGYGGPKTWILPAVSVASFLMPKLARMIEANVSAALESAYARTARAIGASDAEILWRHALPNALLGATALLGAQLAFVVTGLVIIETMFAWPGIGWLLVQSTTSLDFPVVQAITLITVAAVFSINAFIEILQRGLDPRLRRYAQPDWTASV